VLYYIEMHIHHAVIIGGGPSGLGCAKRLTELHIDDFILVTKDIGGRATTSANGQVNYGAYYVRGDYTHLLPYVSLKKRIRMKDLCCLHGRRRLFMVSLSNLRHLPSLLRFLWHLRTVYKHYLRARKRSETRSQREVFMEDPLIHTLLRQPAKEFIRERGLTFWSKHFFDPAVRATSFLDLSESSALMMLWCLFPLITPTYEFEPVFERLLRTFFANIRMDEARTVEREAQHWIVRTAGGHAFRTRNVVLALPIAAAKRLVAISEPTNTPVSVYMAHVRGILKPAFAGSDFLLLPEGHEDIVLTCEWNGTYLFYSRNRHYDLSRYFREWQVIAARHWDPAFHIGKHLLASDRGDGLYVIGDHNAFGMEDSFVTGIFAANSIASRVARSRNC
jgi:glycine/D-amino acid oxidase-like deaminating enzyme